MDYTRLTNDLDEALQNQPETWSRRLFRWLGHLQTWLAPWPLGHGIVESELRKRNTFPGAEWQALEFNKDQVMKVLTILADVAAWPNANFQPNDSFLFVVRNSCIDWVPEQLMERIESEITSGHQVHELIQTALDKDWSVGRFVEAVLHRADGRDAQD